MSCPQLFPCIDAPALPPQPFTKQKARAGEVDGDASPTEAIDCFEIQGFRALIVREERFRARRCSERPLGAGHPRHFREASASVASQFRFSGAGGCFDQFDHPPVG
jgi:hypothetical protein